MQQGQFFDATQFNPDQGGTAHPEGRFPFNITATAIKPVKDSTEGYSLLEVEFTTQAGKISQRYNLWNSPQAVEIAQKQLSALCHATGVHRLDMAKQGAELLNARGQIDVRKQKSNPAYTEVGKVYDTNGNEPGKPQTQQQAPAPAPAPFTPPANNQPPGNTAWPANNAPVAQQAPAPAPAPQAWTPPAAAGGAGKAPWQ